MVKEKAEKKAKETNARSREPKVTNREFAETDPTFQSACKAAGLPFERLGKKGANSKCSSNLARQAGKWRNGKGLARQQAV